jgi:creatinine amidohydrolase
VEVVALTKRPARHRAGHHRAHGAAVLGTDNIIPQNLGEYLAEHFNAILAPCVHYGITKSLYGYPGSLTIKPETFREYIFDILASFSHKGFRRVVILNGHGGNNSMLKEAAHSAFMQFDLKLAVLHWFQLCAHITEEVYGGPGGHGGRDEAGFVAAVDPRYARAELHDPQSIYRVPGGADVYPIPGSVLLYDKEGRGAPDYDIEKGRELVDRVKAHLRDYLEDVFSRWQSFFPEK